MSITLEKGQRINLAKDDGSALSRLEMGINWGMIEKQGVFGKKKVDVDLDASLGLFDESGALVDTVSFRQLQSKCGSVMHTGDDLTGDADGDDGEDNEVIAVNLDKLPPSVAVLGLVLNSFRGQNFADIPYAQVAVRDGATKKSLGHLDVANDAKFANRVSMIMGKVYRHKGAWKFQSIGEPTDDRHLEDTLRTFAREYIN